jgi:hypothetical protein
MSRGKRAKTGSGIGVGLVEAMGLGAEEQEAEGDARSEVELKHWRDGRRAPDWRRRQELEAYKRELGQGGSARGQLELARQRQQQLPTGSKVAIVALFVVLTNGHYSNRLTRRLRVHALLKAAGLERAMEVLVVENEQVNPTPMLPTSYVPTHTVLRTRSHSTYWSSARRS